MEKKNKNKFTGLEFSRVTSYALISSRVLDPRGGSSSAPAALRLPDSFCLTIPVSLGNEQWYHAEPSETELHKQWYLRQ